MNQAMPSASSSRLPHAVLDLPTRYLKALKIERLLEMRAGPGAIRMLEIGCGSGGISHYFGTHPGMQCEVDAVDVCDNRQVTAGYRFTRVDGVLLPFDDGAFDVVISNHVIEHVGDAGAQAAHLSELGRIMAPGATAYLAVPNRWMLVEPHYRLAFLSWLPRPLRTPYLRASGRGREYDCEPLARARLEDMLRVATLEATNVCIEALRETVALEPDSGRMARAVAALPDTWLRWLLPVFPTLCYVIHKDDARPPS